MRFARSSRRARSGLEGLKAARRIGCDSKVAGERGTDVGRACVRVNLEDG
jgi:hypothetical protein